MAENKQNLQAKAAGGDDHDPDDIPILKSRKALNYTASAASVAVVVYIVYRIIFCGC